MSAEGQEQARVTAADEPDVTSLPEKTHNNMDQYLAPVSDASIMEVSLAKASPSSGDLGKKDKGTPLKKPKPAKRKAKDKPSRPLSAYNFFFREERARIMAETSATACAVQEQKSDPVGLFVAVGKEVAARWKLIPKEEKDRYMRMADGDMERYQQAMSQYRLREAQQKEASEAYKAASTPSINTMQLPASQLNELVSTMAPASLMHTQAVHSTLPSLFSNAHRGQIAANVGNDNLTPMLPQHHPLSYQGDALMSTSQRGEQYGHTMFSGQMFPPSDSQLMLQQQLQMMRPQQNSDSNLNMLLQMQLIQHEEQRARGQLLLQHQEHEQRQMQLLLGQSGMLGLSHLRSASDMMGQLSHVQPMPMSPGQGNPDGMTPLLRAYLQGISQGRDSGTAGVLSQSMASGQSGSAPNGANDVLEDSSSRNRPSDQDPQD